MTNQERARYIEERRRTPFAQRTPTERMCSLAFAFHNEIWSAETLAAIAKRGGVQTPDGHRFEFPDGSSVGLRGPGTQNPCEQYRTDGDMVITFTIADQKGEVIYGR